MINELKNLIDNKRMAMQYSGTRAEQYIRLSQEVELLESIYLRLLACTDPFFTEITEMVNRKVDQMLRQPYARKLDAMVFYFHLRDPKGPMYYAGYASNVGYMHSELRLEAYFGGCVHVAKIVPLDILDEMDQTEKEIEIIEQKLKKKIGVEKNQ